MNANQTPVEIAVAVTEAWTGQNVDAVADYLAEDVVFDGPMNHFSGKADYLAGLRSFAASVTGMRMLSAFGDDEHALIFYEVSLASGASLRTAERLTVHEGRITLDELVFDTYPLRTSGAAGTGAAGTGAAGTGGQGAGGAAS